MVGLAAASYYFLLTSTVFAQGGGSGDCPTGTGQGGEFCLPNPLRTTSFVDLVNRLIGYLMLLASPIVAIMVIYGGFQILTAAGDPEKFKNGRQTILYAVIGFAVILLAKAIIAILKQLLGVEGTPNIPTIDNRFQ